MPAIGTSVSLAVGAAVLTTMVAFVIARGLMQTPEVFRAALHALTQLPFALPPILLGIALIGLWNREATGWLYDGLGVVLIGYLARFLPFAIGAMLAGLQQLNPPFRGGRLARYREPSSHPRGPQPAVAA